MRKCPRLSRRGRRGRLGRGGGLAGGEEQQDAEEQGQFMGGWEMMGPGGHAMPPVVFGAESWQEMLFGAGRLMPGPASGA